MSRRSTNLGTGALHYSMTCDRCWDGFSTLSARTWADAEAQAARKGWRFGRRDLCGRCA